ncbi:hypothetical protein JOC94_003009 [Bacillus thermophilus]|uniref:Uncharacterized protein n=1 Tax=Siminovitchia thermophila TaxID=1245522 RepID=A0ABS2R8N3_9BACI|nr:hypothetical protein [Siminovitchia thermophila]MBM7715998.1 hypothetical protein [Siminovitchia thermophila]
MTVKDGDPALLSDRAFMEEWCYVWGNYSRDFYQNLSDAELEELYNELNDKVSRSQQTFKK